jgi:transaldolase
MKVAIGFDHAGFPLKECVVSVLKELGHDVTDFGTHSLAAVDYPDFARAVAAAVSRGEVDRGIVVCGSGVGASVAANKVMGARAALCHDTFSARQGVEDDDLNVLCLGARIIGQSLAGEIMKSFLNARFSKAERHSRRLAKVLAIEQESRRGVFDPGAKPMKNRIRQLTDVGQSLWYDYIRKDLYEGPELRKLIEEDGLRGMTSNPTIFEKAIADTKLYDAMIGSVGKKNPDPAVIFEALEVEDVSKAADQFRSVYDSTGGNDGFVSIEVGPKLANNTEGTLVEARRLWASCSRPNVMVKIPGTKAGIPAIRQCIEDGININVTLLFSVERHREVMEAYLAGLEARAKAGKAIDGIRSVASFFVSRVDTNVDKKLDAIAKDAGRSEADRKAAKEFRGKLAIGNARLAYAAFEETFNGPRWQALKAKGAAVQRPLWASTSVKDPAYNDLYYFEALIGPDTVDTAPVETYNAFRDHGNAVVHVRDDLAGAKAVFQAIAALGISEQQVYKDLEDEGVKKFAESFDKLLAAIDTKFKAIT